ncbi:MAG: methyltransferase domain-containing protein [Devosia sp.]
MAGKPIRRHEDLDLFARIFKVFADTPWLHYGLWLEGETPSMPKLREAQERYVDKLIARLPPAPASILDIGGGTGAMADRLALLGYEVEMLTPSEVQVEIARETLGTRARVHQSRLEEFTSERHFDVCLFSESFQYVPMAQSLPGVKVLLADGGRVVIADCFRSEGYQGGRQVGGGHSFSEFLKAVDRHGFSITADEDVTAMAAPTIALDRRIYREVLSPLVSQFESTFARRRPKLHWLAVRAYRLFVSKSARNRIQRRLAAEQRTPEQFLTVNTYRFLTLVPRKG